MRKRLNGSVTMCRALGICKSFEVVGDIAIVKLTNSSKTQTKTAVESIMSHNTRVKTVLAQVSKISGECRLRHLVCIGGEKKTHTIYREHGCLFSVDLEKCYFSPRLSGERLRVAQLIESQETVVNMFAGVGCFSIVIAKKVPTVKIYSIDLNPVAVEFMQENVRRNRVFGKVIPILGDSKAVVKGQLQHIADRVLMPLPEKVLAYLPYAVSALKLSGGSIHCHCFEHAATKCESTKNAQIKIEQKLRSLNVDFEIPFSRVVRSVGPKWHQVEFDVQVNPREV